MNRKIKPKSEDTWGDYMEAKKAKLLEQFRETASSSSSTAIFKGVAILVNGYTNPSAEELKTLMALHGGTFHQYQSAQTTHIIASNLPNVKIKQGGMPIVKPLWITDSIAAQKLLDYRKYLLYKQGTLTAADPLFLSEFYSNSRLHLISTLGTEFKQLVAKLREKSHDHFPGREKLKSWGEAQTNGHEQVVMHIDMDCFFVSVGLRNRPDLKGLPVAVTHARNLTSLDGENAENSKSSMSEIASCSYEARNCGIKNGMFLGTALKLCPNLKTISYDFEGYREVSNILYKTIANYTLDIEAVSCDEMYVDVTPILHQTGVSVESWATHIRNEVTNATGCPCSAGFGANRLQARLATKRAKPAGQFHLKTEEVDDFMAEVAVANLPGVGYATIAKLNSLGLKMCLDVQRVSLSTLKAELGSKMGLTIHQQSRGIDPKPLNFVHNRKSISVDVNYGIRFKNKVEALNFLQSLSDEVCGRLHETNMRARCLTLKLLVRALDAPKETPKFLGCGTCTSVNRSNTSGSLLADAAAIYLEAKALFERVNIPPDELRGVAIHLTKLEKAPPVGAGIGKFLRAVEDCISNQDKATEKVKDLKEKNVTKTNCASQNSKSKSVNTLKKYFNTCAKETSQNKRNIDIKILKQLEMDEYDLQPKTSNVFKSPFDNLNWNEIKPIVLNWFKTNPSPNDIDVQLIAKYLKQFVLNKKIEELQKILNFFYRSIAKMGLCEWHEVYYKIINKVQEGMLVQYGGTLRVKRKFECSTHS